MDPVTTGLLAGALGGIAGKAVEGLWSAGAQEWFERFFQDAHPKAQAAGQHNTLEFLSRLAVRLEDVESRLLTEDDVTQAVSDVLSDPDFAATFRSALISSARSQDDLKHDVLAQVIVNRLESATESIEAVTCGMAVDVVPKLSRFQLDLLGLLAVIFAIRPPGLPLEPGAPPGVPEHQTSPEEKQALEGFVRWLDAAITVHNLPVEVPDANLTHLAGVGCLVIDATFRGDLVRLLNPATPRWTVMAARGDVDRQVQVLVQATDTGRHLSRLWLDGLQQITLTPLGVVIGTAVHVHKSRGSQSRAISPASVPQRYYQNDTAVWDGTSIDRDFMEQLAEAIRSSVQGGVAPRSSVFGPR